MAKVSKLFPFQKNERLTSIKEVDELFSKGRSHFQFPFKLYWTKKVDPVAFSVKMLVTVPKSYSKKAVDRNLIRRRIKEAYRLNKHILKEHEELKAFPVTLQIAFIYVAKQPLEFLFLEKKLKATLLYLTSLLIKDQLSISNNENS